MQKHRPVGGAKQLGTARVFTSFLAAGGLGSDSALGRWRLHGTRDGAGLTLRAPAGDETGPSPHGLTPSPAQATYPTARSTFAIPSRTAPRSDSVEISGGATMSVSMVTRT